VAHPINGIALAGEVIRLLAARQAVATV
jgi:hypothetical protein